MPQPDSKKPADKAESLTEYYARWERQAREMTDAMHRVDWRGVDWSKLDPKDVGVKIGPPMTAEQFERYRAARRAAGQAAPFVVKKENVS